jgi:hypothetical protein
VITVSEGMVSAIAAASAEEEVATEDKDIDELKLKNTVSTLKETVASQTESINAIAETLKNLNPAFKALQNLVPGDTGAVATPKNTKKREIGKTVAEYDKMTNLEKKRFNQGKL